MPAEAGGGLAALRARALELRLHEQRTWQVLLHYESAGSGVSSLVDDPGFFLSAQGKTDPRGELLATLDALFGEDLSGEEDARCRFVARRAWLEAELGLPATELASLPCPEFVRVWQRVAPRSATLVFPGSYANSPASMFGHTLLIFSGPYQSKTLAHAASYSAFTDETNGLVYALKGLTGGYRGYFTLLPYYEKIKEYSGLERRDMWEYPLRLSPEETEKMFLHLWELRGIYSDYFFFDENCSYNLLYLLEAAKPELQLTEQRSLWVMPIDTVRWLAQKGLLERAKYRPSLAARVQQKARLLDSAETAAVLSLVRGEVEPQGLRLTGEARIGLFDTAAAALELAYVQQYLDLSSYRQRYLRVLAERSLLGSEERVSQPEALPLRPDAGHGSSRLAVGIGLEGTQWFQEWRLRPVYHSLLDPAEGFLAGSQIVLGDLSVRIEADMDTMRLEGFRLVDIISLAPRSSFDAPISWQARIGLRRFSLEDSRPLGLYFNPGGGVAWEHRWGQGYLLLESEGLVSGALQEGMTLGLGASAGWLMQGGDRWRLHLRVRHLRYLADDNSRLVAVEVNQGFKLNRQNGLSLEVSRQVEAGPWRTAATLFWNHYW